MTVARQLRTGKGRDWQNKRIPWGSTTMTDIIGDCEDQAFEQGRRKGLRAGWNNAVTEVTAQLPKRRLKRRVAA